MAAPAGFDLAPAHRSHITSKLIEDHEIKKIRWPGYSPDLNATGFVWGYMKHQISKMYILDIHELADTVVDIWDSLEKNVIQGWIDYIPN